jgi:hypothetical protein
MLINKLINNYIKYYLYVYGFIKTTYSLANE